MSTRSDLSDPVPPDERWPWRKSHRGSEPPVPPPTGVDGLGPFDPDVAALMQERPGDILEAGRHPDFATAVPTPDHFLPLLSIAGLAAESGEIAAPLFEGRTMGSLSMTSYALGLKD